jgi:hypothetical protein
MYPPSTAPKDSSFHPNAENEFPPLSNYARDDQTDPESTRTDPLDTLGGDTSKDVDVGLGKPVYGEDSTELRHDGMHGRKYQRHGL